MAQGGVKVSAPERWRRAEERVFPAQEGWQTEDVALARDARVLSPEEGWPT